MLWSSPAIAANTVVASTAASGLGGGLYLRAGSSGTVLKNNIFYDNIAALGRSVYSASGGGISYCDAYDHDSRYNNSSSQFSGVTVGSAVTYVNPLFVSVPSGYVSGDYHLGSSPLCVDAGLNPADVTTDVVLRSLLGLDMDSSQRPDAVSGLSDIGAYERH